MHHSASRLTEDNIHETVKAYAGEFQGVLPQGRSFEFKVYDQQQVIRGKVSPEIEDADVLNRDYLHKPANVKLHVMQVGQGRPRFTLTSLDDIRIATDLR